MKRSEKAERIQKLLDELYPCPEIPLDHQNPFTLLVAVLLSAQCTDARVNLVTPKLFKRAPNSKIMSGMSPKEILPFIKSCGLAPQKSKSLSGLAKILENKHNGFVPQTFDDLEALPGVGHKTAGVVMSQAFGYSTFPVDTHIHRLASRWGLTQGKNVEQTEQDLKKLFPESQWNKLHLQIIYFGREYCPARGHDLSVCQICKWAATKKRINKEISSVIK